MFVISVLIRQFANSQGCFAQKNRAENGSVPFCLFALSAEFFLNFSCLTNSVTKIIELASADLTVSDMLNLCNVG